MRAHAYAARVSGDIFQLLVVCAYIVSSTPAAHSQSVISIDGKSHAIDGNVVLFNNPPVNPQQSPTVNSVLVPRDTSNLEMISVLPSPDAQGKYVESGKQAVDADDLCVTDRATVYQQGDKSDWLQLSAGCASAAGRTQTLGWAPFQGSALK